MSTLSPTFTRLTDLPLRLRVARGDLSQAVAAKQLKISVRTFQAWEAGTAFPQPRHRDRLGRWLVKREALLLEVAA